MPEEKQYIEHMALENSEIKALKTRLAELESRQTKDRQDLSRESVIKQEIKNYIQEAKAAPPSAHPQIRLSEIKEIAQFEPSQQVGALVNVALEEGISRAVSIAKNLDNPAILDELHDTLVDHYYEILSLKQ